MNARHLTVRNVPPRLVKELEAERRRRQKSLNQTVIDLLGRALGLSVEAPAQNGLETQAGTWTDQDLRSFEEATALFEQVDEELWR